MRFSPRYLFQPLWTASAPCLFLFPRIPGTSVSPYNRDIHFRPTDRKLAVFIASAGSRKSREFGFSWRFNWSYVGECAAAGRAEDTVRRARVATQPVDLKRWKGRKKWIRVSFDPVFQLRSVFSPPDSPFSRTETARSEQFPDFLSETVKPG